VTTTSRQEGVAVPRPVAADPQALQERWLPFLATVPGKLVLLAAFTVLLAAKNAVAWPAVAVALVALTFAPRHRRAILAAATVGVVAASPPVDLQLLAGLADTRGALSAMGWWPAAVAATLALGCGLVELARRRPQSIVARRPAALLVALVVAMLAAGGGGMLGGAAWLLVAATAMSLSSYLWFFAYAASDARLAGAPPALAQVGYWRPFWGFSNVPIGKSAVWLERVEAKDGAALARVQLGAVRLLAWCTILGFAMELLRWAAYAPHEVLGEAARAWSAWRPPEGLPTIAALVEAEASGRQVALVTRWQSVVTEFAMTVLHMTTWGNSIVAIGRMAGYGMALNTDRPLLSTSIVEFYNRYYFYFKELLATFFFYPVYLSALRSRPKLRLFAATFAAAGFGNFLFHFLRDGHEILRSGLAGGLVGYRVYGAYALVLGVAIGISQLRLQARGRRRPEGLRRVFAIAGVVSFYGLLGIFDARTPYGVREHLAVVVHLFFP
jgi:hypothetical protein